MSGGVIFDRNIKAAATHSEVTLPHRLSITFSRHILRREQKKKKKRLSVLKKNYDRVA
jgi:hypothetical protein